MGYLFWNMISNHILILKRYPHISYNILSYPIISQHILRYPRARTPRCGAGLLGRLEQASTERSGRRPADASQSLAVALVPGPAACPFSLKFRISNARPKQECLEIDKRGRPYSPSLTTPVQPSSLLIIITTDNV